MHFARASGFENERSILVLASNNENSDSKDQDDYPLRVSDMHEHKNPAGPVYHNIPNLDETILSNEDSEEEDYHTLLKIPHRVFLRNQLLN